MEDKRQTNFPLIAHRGGLYYRPQNSMAAFDYILDKGIEWIETDVRLSRDGIPVIFHDERIQQHGSGYRAVRELDGRELKTIDIGGGELLPTVRDIFERYTNRPNYDFDVKDLDAIDVIIPLIREFGLENQTLITSFIPDALQRAREVAPDISRGLLLDRLTGRLVDGRHAVNAARLLDCEFFLPYYKILKIEWAEAARSEGLKVIVWTVNQLSDARRLLKLGVDGLISDRPDYLRCLVEDSQG